MLVMEAQVARDAKFTTCADNSCTTGFDRAHKYNELFHIIENGERLRYDEDLDEREK
jgi:hypothetical protein